MENKVWTVLNSKLFNVKQTPKGLNINCPMCVRRGETRPDTKRRCGIMNDYDKIIIHCFNCQFKSRYFLGDRLSWSMRSFLLALGVDDIEVKKLNFWALEHFEETKTNYVFETIEKPLFDEIELPPKAKTITDWALDGCDNENLLYAAQYVLDRNIYTTDEIYWSPVYEPTRIIIPLICDGVLVGYSCRSVRNDKIRYIDNRPNNLLGNCDVFKKTNRYKVIICEGIFDCKAIDGIGTFGASLNKTQINWINSSDFQKILVPDRDQAGKDLINVAIQNNWSVSIPSLGKNKRWDDDIKDIADATKRYGKIWTLNSIIECATDNPLKIRILEKHI